MMKRLISLAVVLFAVALFTPSMAQNGKVGNMSYDLLGTMLDNSDDENRLLAGDTPIILDFSATWCGPCQNFAPIFAQAAKKYRGEVDFYKVDVDENPELSDFFEIKVVPTVIIIPVSGEPTVYEGKLQSLGDIDVAIKKAIE